MEALRKQHHIGSYLKRDFRCSYASRCLRIRLACGAGMNGCQQCLLPWPAWPGEKCPGWREAHGLRNIWMKWRIRRGKHRTGLGRPWRGQVDSGRRRRGHVAFLWNGHPAPPRSPIVWIQGQHLGGLQNTLCRTPFSRGVKTISQPNHFGKGPQTLPESLHTQ